MRLHLSLLLIAGLLAGCGPRVVPPAGPEPLPFVRLGEQDVTALAELLRMEDSRQLDTVLVARLLNDATPEVRARAALAAGRIGDRAATPLLLRAVADDDGGVRQRAAFALGELADSAAVVYAALAGIAQNDLAAPAIEAVGALGRIGGEAARPAIDAVLTDPTRHATVRHEAALAAWRLPRSEATTALLVAQSSSTDPELRWRAVYSLARNGSPAAVPAFLALAGDADDRVRAHAVRGLRAPHADSAGLRERAFDALIAATSDVHAHVRINALRGLGPYRESERATPVLSAALGDVDANVAIAAAETLGALRDTAAAAPLRAVAADGRRAVGLRTAALAALLRTDAAAAGTIARDWADSANWILRQHAARTLATTPWPEAAPLLQRLAGDTHYLVGAEGLAAIRAAGDTLPELRRIWLQGLGARHPLVRAAAARGLARIAGAQDLDVLLQAYAQARQDSMRDAALAVLEALQQVARRGTPVDRAFYLRFGGHGAPADAAHYRAIVQRIGEPPAGWTAPAERPQTRPITFYADIVRSYVAPVLAGGAAPRAVISTHHGDIEIELAAADAPLTVHNFVGLIERGYYTGTRWHRVVPNFVIQDGDPRGDGSGGPGHTIRDEINMRRYLRGTVGMALSGPDTGGSQYFITHSPQPHLDGGYTIFGQVRDGLEVVDLVVQEDPILGMRVIR